MFLAAGISASAFFSVAAQAVAQTAMEAIARRLLKENFIWDSLGVARRMLRRFQKSVLIHNAKSGPSCRER